MKIFNWFRKKELSTRDLVRKLEKYEFELEQIGRALNRVHWKKDLVEPSRWNSKYEEAMADGQKTAFHFSSFITHIRCLHQWQFNSPPESNKKPPQVTTTTGVLADEDQEFLNKLEEARKWKSEQK